MLEVSMCTGIIAAARKTFLLLFTMGANLRTPTFGARCSLFAMLANIRTAAFLAYAFLSTVFAFVSLNSCPSAVGTFQARFIPIAQPINFETAGVEFLLAACALDGFVNLFGFGCGGHVYFFLYPCVSF
jgi:hypothetical protein